MCNWVEFFIIDICVYCDANVWIFVLIDRILNSQTSKPIWRPQSPIMDLVIEEEQEDPSPTTNVEGNSSPSIEVVNGDENED